MARAISFPMQIKVFLRFPSILPRNTRQNVEPAWNKDCMKLVQQKEDFEDAI